MGKRSKINGKKHYQNGGSRSNSYSSGQSFRHQRPYGFKKNPMYDMVVSGSFNRSRSTTTITPERRRQLEEERKKRELYEANFKCDFEKTPDSQIDDYM